MDVVRIATRNSPLALWQAKMVRDQLLEAHQGLTVVIVGMTTRGDELLDQNLSKVGGKGLFLKELQSALLDDGADIAVHSMKDVPIETPEGLEITTVFERADARDAFVSNNYSNLYALPAGAQVGTSSLRRVVQLKKAFPELVFVECRGNVNTRLTKLDRGDYDAIILAAAGLMRLGFDDRIKQFISSDLCLPAVGQGIIGVECRSNDQAIKDILAPLHSHQSELVLTAERAMNAKLDGGCHAPVAGYAQITKGQISMRGLVGAVDASKVLFASAASLSLTPLGAQQLGNDVGEELLRQGADELLNSALETDSTTIELDKPKVFLTRQASHLGNSLNVLNDLDYLALHVPAINIESLDNADMLAAFDDLQSYSDIVFVSRNAAEIAMPIIEKFGGLSEQTRVMAMGSETAKQLLRYGIDALFPGEGTGAQALLNVGKLSNLEGRKILYVRGEIGLDWPVQEMINRGAEVVEVKCYVQTMPANIRSKLREALAKPGHLDAIFIHSVQSLEHLLVSAGENITQLKQATLIVGAQRISDVAQERGWLGEVRVAQSPSNKHMMMAFSG